MRKFILALVFGALLLPDDGFTLGMGDIEVNSALNQQLNARIELLSSVPEDVETLIVKLAAREEFVRAGLDRPYTLSDLKFRPFVENSKVYIQVTTAKPIREPFLNFLIEVDWPKGHLIREYTILLDPPVFMSQQDTGSARPAVAESESRPPAPAPVKVDQAERPAAGGFRPAIGVTATPIAVPKPSQSVQSAPIARQSQTYAPVATQQQTSYKSPSGDYRVQAGDTAWSLADSMRPDQSVSVQQMLLAMLRINPEVFINENVNGLKKGYILRIPDRAEITSISQTEAKAIVGEQNALWREYQQALGVDQPASAINREGESEFKSGIRSSSDSRLSIVSAGSGAAASGETKDPTEMTAEELRQQLAIAREQLETSRVENEGLEGDVGSLEQKIKKMQSLLQIEDAAMAEIQSVGAEAEDNISAGEEAAEPAEVVSEGAALDALDQLTGETETETAESEVAIEEPGAAEGEEIFIDEMAAPEQAAEESEVEAAELVAGDVAPREEPGLFASLLGNPLIAGGAALLVLILLAVGYILIKRRRESAAEDVEATLAADLERGLESEIGDIAESIDDDELGDFATDEQVEDSMAEAEDEFDAESTMVLPSAQDTVVTQAVSQTAAEEEEERDDVIAEADVYLAYGIYQQAEELLQNAIKENPDKDSYRVKLAETYFAAKKSDDLVKLGTEMKKKLGGKETSAWQKVVALGKELCPEAAIFQQAGVVAEVDIDDLMPKSPEPMDFDLGEDAGAGDLADLDFDMSMDETAVIPLAEEDEDEGELEFDIGETEAVEELLSEPAAALEEEEFSLDFEASELDIKEEISMDKTPVEEDSVEIDSSELDFDMGLDDDLTKASEISDEMDLSDLGDVDEINTKLDLARAYLDMGDHEGARDILDEVVAGGNNQQKQEAQELISQLD